MSSRRSGCGCRKCCMPDEQPAQLSAGEAARRIRDGLLTSEELVQGCLPRIRAVEPTVQAWQVLDEYHALEQARAADERPRTGVLQLSGTLDHIGLFARGIDDLALLAEQLTGYDERDPDTRPRAHIPFRKISAEQPPIEPMLAFVKTPHWERVDADAKAAYGELIEALGDRVEEVDLLPSARDAWEWQRTIMEAEMAANLEPLWLAGKEKLSERLRG